MSAWFVWFPGVFVATLRAWTVAEPRRIATSNQPVDYGDGGAGGGNRVRLPAPWKSEQPITQAKLDMDRAVRRAVVEASLYHVFSMCFLGARPRRPSHLLSMALM